MRLVVMTGLISISYSDINFIDFSISARATRSLRNVTTTPQFCNNIIFSPGRASMPLELLGFL